MFFLRGNIIRSRLHPLVPGHALFTALIAVLMLAGLYVNYYTTLMVPPTKGWQGFLSHLVLYLALLIGPFFLQRVCYGTISNTTNNLWYVIMLAAPLIFTCRIALNLDSDITGLAAYNQVLFTRLLKIILLGASTLALWFVMGFQKSILPVFRRPRVNWRYLLWLLPVIPALLLASSQPSFKTYYPLVLNAAGEGPTGITPAIMYEALYVTDIIGIEFFFRGLLVIGLARYCGPYAIVPAACFYCAIHFGKPMAEAISSFLGGLFLGWLSYQTKTIGIGIVMHVGIAVMMELIAFLYTR